MAAKLWLLLALYSVTDWQPADSRLGVECFYRTIECTDGYFLELKFEVVSSDQLNVEFLNVQFQQDSFETYHQLTLDENWFDLQGSGCESSIRIPVSSLDNVSDVTVGF
jgi:hypothetical protein